MSEEFQGLGAAFPPVSADTWRRAVEQALGGTAVEKALSVPTDDGLDLFALYTRDDWPAGRSGQPGGMPFTRGRLAPDAARPSWDIRMVLDEPRLAEARAALAADLEGGTGTLALRLDTTADLAERSSEGPWGLRLSSLADLEALFEGIEASLPPVALDAGALSLPLGLALIAFARKHKCRLSAELNFDPLAALAAQGTIAGGVEGALASLGALARFAQGLEENVAAVGIDTRVYHMAGASEAQEIAFALATGAHYLRALEQAGLAPEEAVHQCRFIFAVDSRFFRSLTKLRALRLCWARLLEACGVPEDLRGAGIWAEASFRDLSRRDVHVNILRGVAACFGAALGGADTISVRPFDEALCPPSLFGRRIARNTSLVLAEEGHLSHVLDPAGGAWALETMTEAFATKAWDIFRAIEAKGGMAEVLVSGGIAAMIETVAKARAKKIATRDMPLTGTSIFPDLAELVSARGAVDWPALAKAEAARKHRDPDRPPRGIEDALKAIERGARFESVLRALAGEAQTAMKPLRARRLAEPFEVLRDAADALPRKPLAFLANWGSPRDFRERAAFARNILAAGGIEAVGEEGHTDAAALMAAAKDSGARIIVLCSSDKLYEQDGARLAAGLKALEPMRLYVAGKKGEGLPGVDATLHKGVDAPALLGDALHALSGGFQ